LIFHDLRHTGNQLTANAGANLRELMARMGHDGERAALIYLL
jgi:integrase